MIQFDTVPTVETHTRDNITDVYISHEGRYWTGDIQYGWVAKRVTAFRLHSGESDAIGRALRHLVDRIDPLDFQQFAQ